MIKRRICAVFCTVCALAAFTLTGCQKKESADCLSLVRTVCPPDENTCSVQRFSSFLTAESERTLLCELFCTENPPGEWAGVKEAALAQSRGTDGYEVWVLRAKHPSENERIRELLLRRISLLQSPDVERFLGEEYQNYIASASVYEIEGFLCLLSTGDNDRAAAEIKTAAKDARV